MSVERAQIYLVQWLRDNPSETVPLGTSYQQCELACALVNLGIAKLVNNGAAIMLKSENAANQYLNARG